MTSRVLILRVGHVTPAGLVYKEAICSSIVRQFAEAAEKSKGYGVAGALVVGRKRYEGSHVAERCWIEDGALNCSIRFLDTPVGERAGAMFSGGEAYFAPRGTGTYRYGTTEVVEDGYVFQRFDAHVMNVS